MIKINNMGINFKYPLIYPFNLELKNGLIYGVTAPNGSGKSTLFRTIIDMRHEASGTIQYFDQFGNGPLSKTEWKKKIFYFENVSWLDSNLSGLDYLTLMNSVWSAEPTLVEEAIDFWDMRSYINKKISQYSLGMKQKILLSLYMVTNTDTWIIDEPTLGLDKVSVQKLAKLLLSKKAENKLLIFSSHDGDKIFYICDELINIENQQLHTLDNGGNQND